MKCLFWVYTRNHSICGFLLLRHSGMLLAGVLFVRRSRLKAYRDDEVFFAN